MIIELYGSKKAVCDGISVEGRGYSGPIGALARVLTKKGYNPLESVTVLRNGTTVFSGANLEWWASHNYTESATKCCHKSRYKEFEGI